LLSCCIGSGSIQFSAGTSNRRLIQSSNSTSLGQSSHSGGFSRFFGASSSNNYSTGNNTSTSFWGSENSQASRGREEEERGQILDVADLRAFTLAELKAATQNFRHGSLLGEGGFGKVYKGVIRSEGLPIAIKKLNSESTQGIAEWQVSELITLQN